MKITVLITLLFISSFITAQQDDLLNHTWVFQKMIVDAEEIYQPELEPTQPICKIYYSAQDEEVFFGELNCTFFQFWDISYNNTHLYFGEFVYTMGECPGSWGLEPQTFDDLNLDFFESSWDDEAFRYDITYAILDLGEQLLLILTNLDGNQIYYTSENLSVSNINQQNNIFKIYPNPVENFLSINGIKDENIILDIYDLTRKKLIGTKTSTVNNKLKINVSQLVKGFYLIQLKDKNGQLILRDKFLKQ